jgi:uncharacterized repeat protein (TIGR01451 family)
MRTFSLVIGIFIVIALLVPVQAQEDGLVSEWHFDEGAGNVLKDSSGNGNDGTIYGATWVDGKFGKALSFDGVDDFVRVADSESLKPQQVTVEAWIYLKYYPTVDAFWFVQKGNSNSLPWESYGIGARTQGYGQKFIAGLGTTDNLFTWIDSTSIYDLNNWYHLAMTYDGSILKIYVNGNNENSLAINKNIWYNTNPLDFGKYDSRYINGQIDEVKIYNRALSASEIKANYEGEQTALSITKTASPTSIKQGQTTTITLTVKNIGSTERTDIEIADVLPKDLTLIEGETKKTYASLSPQDSRQFQYSIQINEAGTFNLGQATASYADNKGNYQTIKSKPASIEVIPSLVTESKQTPSKKSNGNAQSASVNLHGEKTDVTLGENVLLKLSAVNIIGNPAMHVQVIIIPPSGWSVTSSEFAKSGAGQYSTTYDLESGGGKDIEVRIVPNQVGEDFQVEGRIIYYFGDDVATREDHTLNLPIKVRAKSNVEMTTVAPQSEKQSTPGFALVIGIVGFAVAALLINKK